jgi:hypothetical protein
MTDPRVPLFPTGKSYVLASILEVGPLNETQRSRKVDLIPTIYEHHQPIEKPIQRPHLKGAAITGAE